MIWEPLNAARALADFPSDLEIWYANWLQTTPGKEGRLASIVAETVAEFRDAIATTPANVLDADPEKIPASCMRAAEALVFFTLNIEIGHDVPNARASAALRAEVFLRQISYGHFSTALDPDDPGGEGTPWYTTEPATAERTLP
jgi:hypothetical protein